MLRQMVWLHWKAARWVMLPLVLLCVGLPLAAVRMSRTTGQGDAFDMIVLMGVWTPMFPFMAAFTGISIALTAWVWDHNGRHIYALSLPVERWEYAMLKMAAGTLLLVVPAAALWLGAWLGSLQPIPEGLHTYVLSFSARFLLAALIAYAVTFALAAGTVRTASIILAVLIATVTFGSIGVEFVNSNFGMSVPAPYGVIEAALTRWPGPFNVFGGSWMLIDV